MVTVQIGKDPPGATFMENDGSRKFPRVARRSDVAHSHIGTSTRDVEALSLDISRSHGHVHVPLFIASTASTFWQ